MYGVCGVARFGAPLSYAVGPRRREAAVAEPAANPISSASRGIFTRVAEGTVWSTVAQAITFSVAFVATPFTIRLFGPEQYGIWVLLNLLTSYLAFADLGMAPASTRFAADALAQSDLRKEVRTIWTSLVLSALPTALAATFLAAASAPITHLLIRPPAHLEQPTLWAVRLCGIVFIGRMLSGILNTAELVRFRLGLYYLINASGSAAQVGIVPLALACGVGLAGSMGVVASAAIGIACVHAFVSGRLIPGFWHFSIDRALIRPLLSFGLPLVMSWLGEITLTASEKLILAYHTTPRDVAHYGVAFSYALLLAALPVSMTQPLLPAFVRFLSTDDSNGLAEFYSRAVRAMLLGVAPATLALVAICLPFLSLWAGAEYGRLSTLAACVLLGGMAFEVTSYIPSRMLVAGGHTKTLAILYWLEVVPYLFAAIFLIRHLGALGAAIAWSGRAIVNCGLMFILARRVSNLQRRVLAHGVQGFFAALVPLLVAAFASGRAVSLPLSVTLAVLGLVLYASIAWFWVATPEERDWLRRNVRRGLYGNQPEAP